MRDGLIIAAGVAFVLAAVIAAVCLFALGAHDAERFEARCVARGGHLIAQEVEAGAAYTCTLPARRGQQP